MPTTDPYTAAADIFAPPEWHPKDRPEPEAHQIPPKEFIEEKADLWLLEGGRGCGKTEACSRYFAKYMRENPGHRGRIIAPTYDDAVEACVKGPSGLQAVDPEIRFIVQPGGSKVVWPNGSEALVLGTPFPKDVDRLRAGGNRHIDWWEEMAANVQLQDAWDQAAFGLRLGDHPRSIASTTPRPTEAYKAIRTMDGIARTHATLLDNPHNPESWRKKMVEKYKGTRLGRQELYGELIDDVPGALWNRAMIEAMRVDTLPDCLTGAVSIDPAATSGPDADDTGIVAGGLGVDYHVYVVADKTCHLPPKGWGRRAVNLYHELSADYIVGETNNGGEMVEHVIVTVDPRIPFMPVTASRGKKTRAQPVASLCGDPEQGDDQLNVRVHLYGVFTELEDQLCNWDPESGDDSPDRLDAFVWLVTKLLLDDKEETDEIIEHYEPVRIGAHI